MMIWFAPLPMKGIHASIMLCLVHKLLTSNTAVVASCLWPEASKFWHRAHLGLEISITDLYVSRAIVERTYLEEQKAKLDGR